MPYTISILPVAPFTAQLLGQQPTLGTSFRLCEPVFTLNR